MVLVCPGGPHRFVAALSRAIRLGTELPRDPRTISAKEFVGMRKAKWKAMGISRPTEVKAIQNAAKLFQKPNDVRGVHSWCAQC